MTNHEKAVLAYSDAVLAAKQRHAELVLKHEAVRQALETLQRAVSKVLTNLVNVNDTFEIDGILLRTLQVVDADHSFEIAFNSHAQTERVVKTLREFVDYIQ